MTDAELALWRRLRGEQLGVKFRRQHPYLEFILDFVCLERKLVIEVDGAQHMNQTAYDEARSAVLKGAGFRLMRFWDNDVLVNTDAVLEAIYVELGAVERKPIPTPAPPLEGEGRLVSLRERLESPSPPPPLPLKGRGGWCRFVRGSNPHPHPHPRPLLLKGRGDK